MTTVADGSASIVVGMSGASGAIYGVTALKRLREAGIKTHLVMTESAKIAIASELKYRPHEIEKLANVVHSDRDIGASIASGSADTIGMMVMPCSIRSLSCIAWGNSDGLLTRAADVTLKERRRLVLVVRETPLHLGHLRAMVNVTEAGGIIMPPVPAFYTMPETIDDIVSHTVARVLDLFGFRDPEARRWTGLKRE